MSSSGAASVTADNANSSVTCNTISKGVIKIKPALVNGGTAPAVISVSGKLGGCTTDAIDSNSNPVTLPNFGSSFKGTISTPNNDCAGLVGPSTATGTVTIKWKASAKLSAPTSTVTIVSGAVSTGLYAAPFGAAYGAFSLGISSFASGSAGNPLSVSGGFTGGTGGANAQSNVITTEDVSTILAMCDTSTGGKGVKSLTIGAGNLGSS